MSRLPTDQRRALETKENERLSASVERSLDVARNMASRPRRAEFTEAERQTRVEAELERARAAGRDSLNLRLDRLHEDLQEIITALTATP